LLEYFLQILCGCQAMDAGGPAGIAKQADETFSFVLRIFEDQQANGLFIDGHLG
jgi:prepilin-type processing-associated H-X9-DG protein